MQNLVSIIMPVYNGELYIKAAIESVIRQSHANWELIIVNDGSTDNTEYIVKAIKDKRIQYHCQSRKGVGAARNFGLEKMRGDFFCFLDADDVFTPDSLKSRVELFESNPESLEFVDGRVEERDAKLQRILRVYEPRYRGNPMPPMLLLKDVCYLGQTWMIRRLLDRKYVMRVDLTHGEDFLFLLGLSRYGGFYDFTHDTILIYRRHSASAMSDLDGLNRGYLLIKEEIRTWPEVSLLSTILYWLKSRKIMFLSFLFNGKSLFKALYALVQWKPKRNAV